MTTDAVKIKHKPKLVAQYPDFASYATWTDRILPVVVLEPIG